MVGKIAKNVTKISKLLNKVDNTHYPKNYLRCGIFESLAI